MLARPGNLWVVVDKARSAGLRAEAEVAVRLNVEVEMRWMLPSDSWRVRLWNACQDEA